MLRRELLAAAGISALLLANRKAIAAPRGDVLICLFLRGGMDGLFVVGPAGDGRYHDLRPSLSVREPGSSNGGIDLDGTFALHPAAAALEPLYRDGSLAVVHAVGATEADRSHFNAQSLVERAINRNASGFTGWLGRHLNLTGSGGGSLRGVTIGAGLDEAMAGSGDVAAIRDGASFQLQSRSGDAWTQALDDLFRDRSRIGITGAGTLDVLRQLTEKQPFAQEPQNGAQYPATGLGQAMRQAAQYIRADLGVEAICVDMGGWDTHAAEAAAMPTLLQDLAGSLAAFSTDLGALMSGVNVVTMSEFGRRAQQNASGGTDHGRGNLMFALGGGVNGGRVYGEWPTLAESVLEEGDLAITTDYRRVLAELLTKRMNGRSMDRNFPGHGAGAPLGIFKG